MMDIHEILKQLPHRYPFLLVDRVLEIEKGVRIRRGRGCASGRSLFQLECPCVIGR